MIINALGGRRCWLYGDSTNVETGTVEDHCSAIDTVLAKVRSARPITSGGTNGRTST